jgi:hypothetical protein
VADREHRTSLATDPPLRSDGSERKLLP